MAEPSNLTPNQEEVMEENVQPAEENRQEETTGEMPAEASEIPTVPEERSDKGKGKVTEEEVDDLILYQKRLIQTCGSIMLTRDSWQKEDSKPLSLRSKN